MYRTRSYSCSGSFGECVDVGEEESGLEDPPLYDECVFDEPPSEDFGDSFFLGFDEP